MYRIRVVSIVSSFKWLMKLTKNCTAVLCFFMLQVVRNTHVLSLVAKNRYTIDDDEQDSKSPGRVCNEG